MDKETYMQEFKKNQFISQLLKCKEIFFYNKKNVKEVTFEQCNKLYFKLKNKEKSLIGRLLKQFIQKQQSLIHKDNDCECCLTMQYVMMFYKKVSLSIKEVDDLIQQTKDGSCEFFEKTFQFKCQEEAEDSWNQTVNANC